MSDIPSLLGSFSSLNKITPEQVFKKLPKGIDLVQLENYLANKVLYPQTVATSKKSAILDLTILKVLLLLESGHFYDLKNHKIYLLEEWFQLVSDIAWLFSIVIEAFDPQGVFTVVEKSAVGLKIIGSLIRPKILQEKGSLKIELSRNLQKKTSFEIKIGQIQSIPAALNRLDLKFIATGKAQLLGKDETELEVAGGPLGIIVDARK